MQRWTSKPLHYALDTRAPFTRADLELINVDQRVPSFSAHVYLDNPRVREQSGTDAGGYAASFAFFGHGEDCWGDEGHCEITKPVSPFDGRAESTAQPANITIEITEALRQLGNRKRVRVTILASPSDPKSDVAKLLSFDELMLVTYS